MVKHNRFAGLMDARAGATAARPGVHQSRKTIVLNHVPKSPFPKTS